ncbi:hypothetical protein GCM10011608_09720 [Micromonospora sonchi]|uniref:Uncharacterized protein n=1 Tax=Micromonospora sonchi TaxID=1763543 RepID=A0A917TLN9_9ACTN|nr:DUF6221 family protein [Micromonospora sonchi]GGM26966.1 hypothetical protein GCM10011608_09720 [Micromonospora sonchi]
MTDERLAWLHAQIDDDEQAANADHVLWTVVYGNYEPAEVDSHHWTRPDAELRAEALNTEGDDDRWNTAAWRLPPNAAQRSRDVAEAGAKRRVLGRHTPHAMGDCRVRTAPHWDVLVCNHCHGQSWPCPDVQDLITLYADRPGYQEMWGQQ